MINRRTFAKAVGAGAAAVSLAGLSSATTSAAGQPRPEGTSPAAPASTPGSGSPFDSLKQVKAGMLNVGYAEAGPADGPPVILMHGFPYDIHSYIDVAPLLAAAGYRVIVPYFRGHGTTTFLSSRTPRTAEQSAFALDTIALMDALKIDKAILAGFDWGSRTGDIIAALWPQRCKALVSVTGYLITNLVANLQPLPAALEWAWWYQYYFATKRGELGLTNPQYRHDLGNVIWKFNSPTWNYTAATYDQTAAAFTNADYVSIVIGNYRWRQSLIKTTPRYAALEKKLATAPTIAVPTITIDGEADPFTPAGNGSAYRAKFTGPYDHRALQVGHNVPQEAPQDFAQAVMDVDKL